MGPMLRIAEALEGDADVEAWGEEYQIQRLFRLSERIDVTKPGTVEAKGENGD